LSDTDPRPIAVLVAVREELKPLRARLKEETATERDGTTLYRGLFAGRAMLLAKSGMGGQRAARAAGALLAEKPACLIIAGFAGALHSRLRPGEVVRAEWVAAAETPGQRCSPNASLLEKAALLPGLSSVNGGLVSVPYVLTTAADKARLAERVPDAVLLDMETAAAAQAAEMAGVPWLSLRAVTDGLADDLPFDFNAMSGADGEASVGRVALAALTHPAKIPALLRLGSRAALAARTLADFLEAFVRA
jgi:adenosylhomocysteine nucleosidase